MEGLIFGILRYVSSKSKKEGHHVCVCFLPTCKSFLIVSDLRRAS